MILLFVLLGVFILFGVYIEVIRHFENRHLKKVLGGKLIEHVRPQYPYLVIKLNEAEGQSLIDQNIFATRSQVVAMQHAYLAVLKHNRGFIHTRGGKTVDERYSYITALLETAFPRHYREMKENGVLLYEVSTLVSKCHRFFQQHGLPDHRYPNSRLDTKILHRIECYLTKEYKLSDAEYRFYEFSEN